MNKTRFLPTIPSIIKALRKQGEGDLSQTKRPTCDKGSGVVIIHLPRRTCEGRPVSHTGAQRMPCHRIAWETVGRNSATHGGLENLPRKTPCQELHQPSPVNVAWLDLLGSRHISSCVTGNVLVLGCSGSTIGQIRNLTTGSTLLKIERIDSNQNQDDNSA